MTNARYGILIGVATACLAGCVVTVGILIGAAWNLLDKVQAWEPKPVEVHVTLADDAAMKIKEAKAELRGIGLGREQVRQEMKAPPERR